jgi:PAS domain S-box-containing protein
VNLLTPGNEGRVGENQQARSASPAGLREPARETKPGKLWLLAGAGLVCFHLSAVATAGEHSLWTAPVGIGIALVSWLGFWIVLPLWADLLLLGLTGNDGWLRPILDSSLLALQIAASWWSYSNLAHGRRRLDDPRSAMLFLLLVVGLLAGVFGLAHALVGLCFGAGESLGTLLGNSWRASALGVLVLVPPLLVGLTPVWQERGLTQPEPRRGGDVAAPRDWTVGEAVEVAGLALAASVLDIALAVMHAHTGLTSWHLWGLSLLVVVWASLRQGLRGGALAAGMAAVLSLLVAASLGAVPEQLNPLQGSLLAQCSAALLVGASSGWLQASEARYRQIIGHMPVFLYSVRVPRWVPARFVQEPQRSGRERGQAPISTLIQFAEITLASPACRQLLSCEPEDLEGPVAHFLERILPADREVVLAALAQLCLQRQPVTCEYRLAVPLGSRPPSFPDLGLPDLPLPSPAPPQRWLRDTLAPHYGPDGHLDGWEGIVEDITEQRALAHDLRQTGGMLHALVSSLPIGVYFVHGSSGQPILVNSRARQLLGRREDPAAGLSHLSQVYRLHRPDGSDYPWQDLPVARASRQGTSCMADDIVVHRADGRRIHLVTWAAPVDMGMGKIDAVVWVLEDLSALRMDAVQQESELRLRTALDAKYQNLVDSLPLMVLQFNTDGQVGYLNAAAQQLLGFSAAELRRPGFLASRILAEDRPQFRTALERCLKGYVTRVEVRYQASDESVKIGYAVMQPQTHNGTVTGATCLVVDMTLQRRLEQELQRSQRLELMGRLASGTIHDFNNLLTAMMGMAALAQTRLPAAHPAHDELERILDSGEQAAHLAGQLLAFGKQQRIEPRPVDLNQVVAHTLRILHSSVPPNILIESHLSPVPVVVRGDETQLKQVLMNLVLNARDAMPQGGTLTIETGIMSPDAAAPAATRAHMSVRDTGQGMTDAVRKRIFEPFFSTKERGSGLGLAVVQQIVHSHGGHIDVASQQQQGTCFDVRLPLPPDERVARPESSKGVG